MKPITDKEIAELEIRDSLKIQAEMAGVKIQSPLLWQAHLEGCKAMSIKGILTFFGILIIVIVLLALVTKDMQLSTIKDVCLEAYQQGLNLTNCISVIN